MKPRRLAVLVLLAVAALATGWYFDVSTAPQSEMTADNGRLMFPGLAAKLDQAAQVELVHGAVTLKLAKDAKTGSWGVAERGSYPADVAKLRGLLTALTELRLVERRTAEPSEFAKLGLEDPTSKDATGTLVRVQDAAGKTIAELVAGHTRFRTGGNLPEQVYIRAPDQNQTWLAEGKLDLDADPLTWLDRDIMDIKPAQVASVAITNGESRIVLARSGDKLAMREPSDHPPLDSEHLDDVQRALDLLSLQDVLRTADAPKGDALGSAVFTTTDGLAITATPVKSGSDLWVSFAASGIDDKAAAKAEATKLNARLAGWIYQIGSWKQKALVPTMEDLKAPPPPAASPSQASSPAPAAKP